MIALKILGLTLIHSLWQGAVIALALFACLSIVRSAPVRYSAAWMALLSILASWSFTLFRLWPGPPAAERLLAGAILTGSSYPAQTLIDVSRRINAVDALPWLGLAWIIGVLLFQIYAWAGWFSIRRLGHQGICAVGSGWTQRLEQLCATMQMSQPVTLLESCLTEVPVVIGYLRPLILVPAGILASMPVSQMEAILLHELAHIRRYDYMVNLLQTAVESFLFYHPAVWWIGTLIRTERENCCDDLAVAATGNSHVYASALATLEQNRSFKIHLAAASNGGNLMQRIRRLLYPVQRPRTVLMPALSVAILTVAASFTLMAWQSPPKQTEAPAFQHWLKEDVGYIISDEESAAFRRLTSNEDRTKFVEQFWERRNPQPGMPENTVKEEHYRRIAYVNVHYSANVPGWQTDRGRIYIIYGPADEIESHPSGGAYKLPPAEGGGTQTTFPFEQWLYRHIDGLGNNVIIEFVDENSNGDYQMTKDPHAKYTPK